MQQSIELPLFSTLLDQAQGVLPRLIHRCWGRGGVCWDRAVDMSPLVHQELCNKYSQVMLGGRHAAVAAGRRHRAKPRCMGLSSPWPRRQALAEMVALLSTAVVGHSPGRSPGASVRCIPTQTRSPETRMDGQAGHASRCRPRIWSGKTGPKPPAPLWRRRRLAPEDRKGLLSWGGRGARDHSSRVSVARRSRRQRPQVRLKALSKVSGTKVSLPLAREQATYNLLRVSGLIVRKLPACHAFTFPGFRTTHTSP